MQTAFLSALKSSLSSMFDTLALSAGQSAVTDAFDLKKVNVHIGDLPAGAENESLLPCIIIIPLSGEVARGELLEDVAFLAGIYPGEASNAEDLELALAKLRMRVVNFLREACSEPIAARYLCIQDEKNCYMRWQRTDPVGQPRPFAHVAIISRWAIPGRE